MEANLAGILAADLSAVLIVLAKVTIRASKLTNNKWSRDPVHSIRLDQTDRALFHSAAKKIAEAIVESAQMRGYITQPQ